MGDQDASFSGEDAVGCEDWTVLDADLQVVPAADSFLRQVRFGRDGAESTTRSYAYSIALFLRWCARSGRTWQSGVEQVGLFMTWLAHALPAAPGDAGGVVLRGPGAGPARGARRVNAVLAAVRGMTVHAVAEGTAGGHLVPRRELPHHLSALRRGRGFRRRRVSAGVPVLWCGTDVLIDPGDEHGGIVSFGTVGDAPAEVSIHGVPGIGVS